MMGDSKAIESIYSRQQQRMNILNIYTLAQQRKYRVPVAVAGSDVICDVICDVDL